MGFLKADTVRALFKLSAFVNVVGMVVMTKGYTDVASLMAPQPTVFSLPSCLLVQVWGLAFYAVADTFEFNRGMCLVFTAEKVLYTGLWLSWMAGNAQRLPAMWSEDWLVGFFYSIYGVNDALFALVFAYAASFGKSRRRPAP